MLRFSERSLPTLTRKQGQMRTRISKLPFLSSPPHPGCKLHSELVCKARIFFGIAGVLVGVYVSSIPAVAEIEDGIRHDAGTSGYSIPTSSDELIYNILNDNNININNNFYIYYENQNEFDNSLIPDSVWSLDVSTGVHLDRVSDGRGSDILGTEAGRRNLWSTNILGLWNDTDQIPNLLATLPLLQVASCGGNSPERRDLDRCDYRLSKTHISENPKVNNQANGGDAGISKDTNNDTASGLSNGSTPSAATFDGTLNTVYNLSPHANAALFSSPNWQYGALSAWIHDLTALIDGTAQPIDDSTATVDASTMPVDGQTTPNDLGGSISGDEGLSGSVGSPIYGSDSPPLPPSKPIPEASTWVMTITGFGIMVFVFGKKRRFRIGPISIVDDS